MTPCEHAAKLFGILEGIGPRKNYKASVSCCGETHRVQPRRMSSLACGEENEDSHK